MSRHADPQKIIDQIIGRIPSPEVFNAEIEAMEKNFNAKIEAMEDYFRANEELEKYKERSKSWLKDADPHSRQSYLFCIGVKTAYVKKFRDRADVLCSNL